MSVATQRRQREQFRAVDTLVTNTCPTCGVLHAYPQSLDEDALARRMHSPNARGITCPNGHQWWYTGASAETKLKREREAAEAARRERNEAERRATAQHRAATRARNERDKIKRRTANGVCPCCGRTFKQLAEHMKAKHPDFIAETAAR